MNYSKFSDEELVVMLEESNSHAYTEIFERYNSLLLRHAFKLLSKEDDTYDVVQDVFLNLWQRRAEFTINSSLSAYLFTAVKNRIFKLFAHKEVVIRYERSLSAFMVEGYDIVEEGLMEKELSDLIKKEIDALPTRMREVFLLNKTEELSYKEIAQRLNISDQTAKQQVYKAIKILKPKIDQFLSIFLFL
ncbi:MAG TPA: RNA polymerase sigma-70 factor [Pedobacter sp.]|jgi:RNA polymerase sigma-70 factor (ECF subfamily)